MSLEKLEALLVHLENDPHEVPDTIRWAIEEINRLRYRLNHQTEDDIEMCRQGKHKDCGA